MMSYRCSACQQVSKPRQARSVWRVLRPDGQIEREVPVCPSCLNLLELGTSFRSLTKPRPGKAQKVLQQVAPTSKKVAPIYRPAIVPNGPVKLLGRTIVSKRSK